MTDRRKFLTGVVAAGAATAVAPRAGAHSTTEVEAPKVRPPSMHVAAAETATPNDAGESSRIKGVPGSDFMVDVIKTLGIKYVPSNCASATAGFMNRWSTTAATRCRSS